MTPTMKRAFIIAGIIGILLILGIILTSCSCEPTPPLYGENNLTIRYVNYTNASKMLPDCAWDAQAMRCKEYKLIKDTCHLKQCIEKKPVTQRSCGGIP